MMLDQLLRRGNNNADLLRLIAATAVIWGHAYALVPEPGVNEPLRNLLGFDYSGSLAVKVFFFLSGILVTNSWLTKPSAIRFASARIFRIFPLLIVSSIATIVIMGPALTSMSVSEYFHHRGELMQVLLHPYIEYTLPGVFEHALYSHVNGSIWTIKYELMLYALLLGAGMCGLFRFKLVGALVLLAVIVVCLIWPDGITAIGLPNVNMGGRLPAFFAFGALLAVHKERVRIDGRLCIGLIVLALAVRHGPAFEFAFLPAFFITGLWIMSLDVVKAIRPPGDFSYGVYVFGWPLQNTFANLFPKSGIHGNQVMTFACALFLAIISWILVEKPCIALGRKIPSFLQRSSQSTIVEAHRAQA
ncbi:acyltransferase [Paraburkholderia sp. BL10I2N1]|uniref:acyltransferase family protein n=1 Tax=Paraburkholderia sp. BL10I2N1 TaxID=1938796 RepID=UPI00105CC230|nr:acyltransferase [Paraburkholderia sp. BL10I2N1]